MQKKIFYTAFILTIIALSNISFAQTVNDPLKGIEQMSAENWDSDKDIWKTGVINSIEYDAKKIVIDDIEYKISKTAKFTDNKDKDLSFYYFKKGNSIKFVISGKDRKLITKLIKP
jgi:Cu/Ag efflux protein CusF